MTPGGRGASGARAGDRPLRVLIVEDDRHIRAFERATLEGCGYEVIDAEHGAAALGLVAKLPPDVIVLDINMPVMDGHAFAVAYRALPGPHAPIVVTTAAGFASLHGDAVGAAAALGKPFDLDQLCGEIERLATATGAKPTPARV